MQKTRMLTATLSAIAALALMACHVGPERPLPSQPDARQAQPDLGPVPTPDVLPLADLQPRPDSRHPVVDAKPIDAMPKVDAYLPPPPPPPKAPKLDVLFVIDNSGSMEQEQIAISRSINQFLDNLGRVELGKDPNRSGDCTTIERSGCRLPDLRIGVISTDIGAGNFALPSCEDPKGDRGALLQPKSACSARAMDPWLAYDPKTGWTNIPKGDPNPLKRTVDAFKCLANVGVQGCGFEQPFEAMRKALDPQLGVNPGFLRKDADLAVIIVSDEDDCSARDVRLYDPSQQGTNDPLGPLTSFRCFEFGVTCDQNGRAPGARTNCKPTVGGKLFNVSEYERFLRTVKANRRVVVNAIAGPTSNVAVKRDGSNPSLASSCQGSHGVAVPSIRIANLVRSTGGVFASICDSDYGPAMLSIAASLSR